MISHQPGDLGVAIYKAFARRSNGHAASPNTEPTSFGDALRYFVKAASGNVSAAARLMGVPRRSLRDWLGGVSTPPRDRQTAVARSAQLSARRQRLTPSREAKLRGLPAAGIVVTGEYNYDGPPARDCLVGQYMEANSIDVLADAYLSGASPAELRAVFAGLVTEDPTGFYAGTLANPPTDDHGWTVYRVTL